MRRLVVCGIAASLSLGVFAESWQNDEGVIRTWNSGQLLPATYEVAQDASRKTVVLENVQLADVEVVSSKLNANNWPTTKVDVQWVGTAKPYNAVRTADTLTVELMSVDVLSSVSSKYNSGRTVFLVLTLVQDGDNVCASVSNAWYVDACNLLGVDLLSEDAKANYTIKAIDLATPMSTNPGYGVDQLTFSIRTPAGKKDFRPVEAIAEGAVLDVGTNVSVAVSAANFAQTTIANAVTLAPGAELTFEDLANDTEVKPMVQGNAATIGFHRTTKEHLPVAVVETDTNVINIARIPNVLLASVTNVSVRSAKKYLWRNGWKEDGIQIWHFTNNVGSATFQVQYKEDALRCVMVTMKQDGDDIVLGYAARGKGGVDFGYVFGPNDGGLGYDGYTPERDAEQKNYLAIRGVTLYCDTGVVNVGVDRPAVKKIYNVSLSSVTNVAALYGKAIATAGGWLTGTSTYFFENNGQTATCQIQWLQGKNVMRGQLVTLKQNGSDVDVTYWSRTHDGDGVDLGWDITQSPFTTTDTVSDLGSSGLAVKGLVLYMNEPQTKPVQPFPNVSLAAGDLGITNGIVKIDGEMRLSITNTVPGNKPGSTPDYRTTFMPLMVPGGWFELSDGAQLVIEDWGQNAQMSYGVNRCGFRIGENCLMVVEARNWMLDCFFPYELNGGELRLGGYYPSGNGQINQYVDSVVFEDGSRLTGRSPMVGYIHSGEWRVRGEKPSVCETGVALNGHVDGARWLKLYVDDVTDDETVDFAVEGPIIRAVNGGELAQPNCGVWKLGKGTAKLESACTYSGETKVTDGTLLLGTSQCILATNKVTVAGGTLALAEGTSQAFGIFAFGAGTNTLEIAKGATVTFGEMTFGDDVLAINVAGEDASTCVFPRMPAKIRRSGLLLNGERAMQDAEGHVVPYEPQGAVIIFR